MIAFITNNQMTSPNKSLEITGIIGEDVEKLGLVYTLLVEMKNGGTAMENMSHSKNLKSY
jgi:hypothetical protein